MYKYSGMTMLACVDPDWGIADGEGNLLFNLQEADNIMARYTRFHTVVMGYATYEHIYHEQPIADRHMVILGKGHRGRPDPCNGIIVGNINELTHIANPWDSYIVGGAQTYHQLLTYTTRVVLIQTCESGAKPGLFFPKLDYYDVGKNWAIRNKTQVREGHDKITDKKVSYYVCEYVHRGLSPQIMKCYEEDWYRAVGCDKD